ncbi:MAG: hypothetical protein DMD83_20505 [Candidatus Rokuibacteriota bacterium]|nr:MAG: hypothetical protein DMD83_20505 [Candidatus Rokubacteria bacterium]
MLPKGSLHFHRVMVDPVSEGEGLEAETKYMPETPTARAGVGESAGRPVSGSLPTTARRGVVSLPTYMSLVLNA